MIDAGEGAGASAKSAKSVEGELWLTQWECSGSRKTRQSVPGGRGKECQLSAAAHSPESKSGDGDGDGDGDCTDCWPSKFFRNDIVGPTPSAR